MNGHLIFGAAYYEEYLPCDRLELDMTMMAEAGFNTIRIGESTWSVHERREDEIDFSHVIRVIEAADRHGLHVIVGTPTYAVPVWLAAKDKGILGPNPFGPRQNMDITNPTYRKYAERIIRSIVAATASYPNVIGYQIDNETKHYGVHSQAVIEGFRGWLKKRFGSVEAVNAAFLLNHWSNSAASFEELPDPTGTVNGGYACAFEEYRRELAADFLKWQSAIVSEEKRDDQFITHNFDYEWIFFGAPGQQDGFSGGLQPDLNCFEAARAVTIAGTDIYAPAAKQLTGMEIAFGGDIMRPLKRAPYLVLESQSQAFTGWLPYPGQLRLMAFSHIASGAAGLLYWPWMSLYGGIESYWKGILSHDGEPGPTYEEVKRIGSELRLLSRKLEGFKKKNSVAMILSPEALHALRHFPTDKNVSYNSVVREVYAALYELNIECDLLYDRETDWSSYRLLIFPQLYCTSDEMIERIRAFTAGGGTIFVLFRSFFADQKLQIRSGRQPYGLTDVFGMHYSRFTKSENHYWMELLETDGSEIKSYYSEKYWNEYASVTRNSWHKGTAWYIGAMPQKDDLKKYLSQACEDACIRIPSLCWPVVCRRGYEQNGREIIFLFNYASEPASVLSPASGTDLLTGDLYGEGDTIALEDYGAVIMITE